MSLNVVLAALPNLDVPTLVSLLEGATSPGEPHHAQAHDLDGHLILTSQTPFAAATIHTLHEVSGRTVFHIAASQEGDMRLWQVYSAASDRMWIFMDGAVHIDDGEPDPVEADFDGPFSVSDLVAMVGSALSTEFDPWALVGPDVGTPVLLPR